MENVELKKDIDCAKKLLNGEIPEIQFSERNQIYPFTTENIRSYLNLFDLKNKKILTVSASGDHAFNSILLGAREIDCFDINRLTRYYMELKKAGIMTLDFKNFVSFFTTNNHQTFNPKTYVKVREKLNDDTKLFWDSIYDEVINISFCSPGEFIAYSNLFFSNCHFRMSAVNNLYLSREKYNKVKDVISDVKISYINSNLLDLPKILKSQYDLIMLSNISDYLDQIFLNYPLEEFRDFIINDLSKLLGIDGQIILAYVYGYRIQQGNSRSGINNPYRRNIAFNNYFSCFELTDSNDEAMDAVFVYKNSNNKH